MAQLNLSSTKRRFHLRWQNPKSIGNFSNRLASPLAVFFYGLYKGMLLSLVVHFFNLPLCVHHEYTQAAS
jgi:hypothetical protein